MRAAVASQPSAPASAGASTRFLAVALLLVSAVMVLALAAPVPVAIAALFVCAGPHNWIEARYMLSRLPSRAGPLAAYMLVGGSGVVLLGIGATLIPSVTRPVPVSWLFGTSTTDLLAMTWNLALVAWLAALLTVRARQKPVRDWWWVAPGALLVGGLTCLHPLAWSLGLVYLHPFVAFWILDRELRARRRELRPAYHAVLLLVPVLLLVLWWQLHDAPPLPGVGQDALTMRLLRTAGVGLVPALPVRFLLSSHVLLETLHYAVWLVAIPALALREAPWRLTRVPLAARSRVWRTAVQALLGVAACVVVVLWVAFSRDYVATRDVYFTLAIVHVLAEAPLLIRLL